MSPGAPRVRRWPLLVIAAPAAVAVWSGWVGLGGLCGFGLVQPLPGIVAWHLNTAITLPVGVEAYGTYALGVWLHPATPDTARRFARRSAAGALVLGALGQVCYHLLAAAHASRAPWPVVVLVACLPVAVLGFAAMLTHLRRVPAPAEPVPARRPARAPAEPAPARVPAPVLLHPVPAAAPGQTQPGIHNGHDADVSAVLAAHPGTVPGIREVKATLHCGQDRARQVRNRILALEGVR